MIKKHLAGIIFFSTLKPSRVHTNGGMNNCTASIAAAELNSDYDQKIRPCFKDGNA